MAFWPPGTLSINWMPSLSIWLPPGTLFTMLARPARLGLGERLFNAPDRLGICWVSLRSEPACHAQIQAQWALNHELANRV